MAPNVLTGGPPPPVIHSWMVGIAVLLAASESNVRHRQLPAQGPVRPLVPWCFGAAKGRFWRLASWNLELISCRIPESNVRQRQLPAKGPSVL